MIRRGFTMLELLLAVMLLGIMTTISIVTYRAVTTGWRVSRDYVDRLERTDYALDQLVSGLKCAYYPHNGEQSGDYGFMLTDNGDGEDPDDSDIIEWTKKGNALIGGVVEGDGPHRIQVRVLEEGDSSWGTRIERTGLYARVRSMSKGNISSKSSYEEDELTFDNEELYHPMLIAKDVEGFNCRVQEKEPEDSSKDGHQDKDAYEDEFSSSNSLPYKVQLTFYVLKEDPEYASRKQRVPIIRVVRLPVHEQSLDGAALPGDEKESKTSGGKGGKSKK